VEGADLKERASQAALIIVIGVADLVGVAAEGHAGGAGLFRHGLTDGRHCRSDDGQGQDSDNEYRDQFRFHCLLHHRLLSSL